MDSNYRKTYWELFNNLHSYKQISPLNFRNTLIKNSYHINYVLSKKKLVEHFNTQIREFLMGLRDSAEIIITGLEQLHQIDKFEFYLPTILTLIDRQDIIERYIESVTPNLNYLNLIVHSKDQPNIKLSPKIKLKAQKKLRELSSKIMLNSDDSSKFGFSICFSKIQEVPKKITQAGLNAELSYSTTYLDGLNDIELLDCFSSLFEFTDNQRLITLVAKENERIIFERFGMISKNAYPVGPTFQLKVNVAFSQTQFFDTYLKQRDNSVEKLINNFILELIRKKDGLQNMHFTLPDENASYLTKIRVLAPEMESLLKQYHCYVKEDKIDFELLQINSLPLNFSEVASVVVTKYVYIKQSEVIRIKFLFFSDQSSLFYVKNFEDKYNNLYDLLINEDVNFNLFANYQEPIINELLVGGYLKIDTNNYIKIAKPIHLGILRLIHNDGVLNYWSFDYDTRKVIDEMVSEKHLEKYSSLFADQEISFFNFFLNKKQFTNGFDIRNKYLHGTNEHNLEQQKKDYYFLLILIILTLIKIDDDLGCGIISHNKQHE